MGWQAVLRGLLIAHIPSEKAVNGRRQYPEHKAGHHPDGICTQTVAQQPAARETGLPVGLRRKAR